MDRAAAGAVALVMCASAAAAGAAQSGPAYPVRTVRVIVPYPASGAVDLLARPVAQKLGERLGQNVIVDNRAGATGIIGAEAAARSAPDGYTVLIDNVTGHAINPALIRKLPFDTLKDFAPVTLLAWVTNVIIVHPSLPLRNVKELIALARARPGQLSYAHFGVGGTSHLAGELLKTMAKIDIVHVPYKGGGPAMADLIGGQIPINFATVSTASAPVKSGRARALAVTGAARSSALPGVPTVAEAGVPGYDVNNWYGMLAPSGTPREIVTRLHAETVAAMQSADLAERLGVQGYDIQTSTPERFVEHMRQETQKYGHIVRQAGIKIE